MRQKVQIVFRSIRLTQPAPEDRRCVGGSLLINTKMSAERRERRPTCWCASRSRSALQPLSACSPADSASRIAIARALMLNPKLLVLDERFPRSSLGPGVS